MTGQEGAYRPGLDGIRALAVTAVIWFHLDRLPGGNLGVDAFFVVSGWLITWKLLAEADSTGGIDLRRFWTGRIRRLMPASMAVLATVALLWPLLGRDVPTLRRDLLFAAGWSSNWGTITSGGDYWARFGDPSPVTHFWSLAIEEQYYLVWPLLLALVVRVVRRHRLGIGVVSAALAIASITTMLLMFDAGDPTSTYMNTFARAHSLLLGAAAAAFTTVLADGTLRGGRTARRIAPFGAAGAIAIIAAVSIAPDSTTWLYRWGFPAFAMAMVPVVVAAADGAGVKVLASPAMRWVSDRSYGLYLWHWPVFLLLSPDRVGISDGWLPTLLLDLVRTAAAVALADASYRWLETPVRRRRNLIAWRGPVAAAAAMTVVTVLAVTLVPAAPATTSDAIVALPPPPSGAAGASTGLSGASSVSLAPLDTIAVGRLPSPITPPTPAVSTPSGAIGASEDGSTGDEPDDVASMGPVPAGAAASASMGGSAATAVPAATDPVSPTAPAGPVPLGRPLRVLVTGDSTARQLAEALIAHAQTMPDDLVVGSGAFPGCGLSAEADGRMHEFTDTDGERDLVDLGGCIGQWDSIADRVTNEAVDVVLVQIGPWDAVDIHLADGPTVSVGDPAGRAMVAEAYREFADEVVAAGARIVWVTPTDTHLGWGEVDDPLNDPVRWTALRKIVDALGDDLGVAQIDLPTWLADNDLTGPDARPDGVHLSDDANERFVVELVTPTLIAMATTPV